VADTPGGRLRRLLDAGEIVVAPGAFNALIARLIEEAGFPALYVTGAGVANSLLGRPDIGLVTADEMLGITERICEVASIPVICDADTGYGGAQNVARTVRAFERAGAAAVQIEDQIFPKVCGHFEGKQVVPVDEMLERIRAARDARSSPERLLIIARTDARQPHGLDDAIDRGRAYGEAGADVIFVEAPQSREELQRVADELGSWPLMANMVEFGKTPQLTAAELGRIGFSLVIHPGSVTRTVVRSVRRLLGELATTGTTKGLRDEMATFEEVNRLVGLDDLNEWERRISGTQLGETNDED
jgi:2-methylisocitrate lyase-like PEP mutase family enzyme